MARKKNKSEVADVDLSNEPGIPTPAEAADPPLDRSTDPESSPDVDLVMASPPAEPPVAVPVPPAPSPPAPSPPAPSPPPVGVPQDLLEERIRRLEEAVTQLGQLQGLEQRLSSQLQREPPPAGPGVLTSAAALMDAGRQLLPVLTRSSEQVPPPRRPTSGGWLWLLRETLAELQATYYMYVDPRYHLSWVGRIFPPVLLVLFVFSSWWVKYAFCGLGALPLVEKPIELLLLYALVKIVGTEARRYRETAPDLPPSLRL